MASADTIHAPRWTSARWPDQTRPEMRHFVAGQGKAACGFLPTTYSGPRWYDNDRREHVATCQRCQPAAARAETNGVPNAPR
jgi:hypothetical protein